MEQLNPETIICEDDGVTRAVVYTGGFDNLKKISLRWRKDGEGEFGLPYKVLTLAEISKQLQESRMITIFVTGPLSGYIFQYGYYGDSWYTIGTTNGYA